MKLIAKHIGILYLILLGFIGFRMCFGLFSYCAISNRLIFGFTAYVVATVIYINARKKKNLSLEIGAIFQNILLMVIAGYAFSLFVDYFIIWFINTSLAEEISIAFFNFNSSINELFGSSPVEKAKNLANFEARPAEDYNLKSYAIFLFFSSLVMATPFALIVTYFSRIFYNLLSKSKIFRN